MKLLIGGSPCTHWSIAQTKNRETEPQGMGWELFKNYLVALEKYKPNFFLYENNKSISAAIREQITRELGVEPIEINSSLVSAQSRKRLYWTNIPVVEQPKDKGILLRDIMESGLPLKENGYTLAEPVRVGDMPNASGEVSGSQSGRIYSVDGKGVPLQAGQTAAERTRRPPACMRCLREWPGEAGVIVPLMKCGTTRKPIL